MKPGTKVKLTYGAEETYRFEIGTLIKVDTVYFKVLTADTAVLRKRRGSKHDNVETLSGIDVAIDF